MRMALRRVCEDGRERRRMPAGRAKTHDSSPESDSPPAGDAIGGTPAEDAIGGTPAEDAQAAAPECLSF